MHALTRMTTRPVLVAGGLMLVLIAVLVVLSLRGIRLHSETVVDVPRERVWDFFREPQRLAAWDRSVARVEATSPGPIGEGYTFDTIGPPGDDGRPPQRSSYRVAELVPGRRARVDLVDSATFARAQWHVAVAPVADGTRIVIDVVFAPKPQYFFLTPVLYVSRRNLMTDMEYLRTEVEAYARDAAP